MKCLQWLGIALSAIGMAVLAPVGTNAANLVSNGSFENYTGGYGGAPSQLAGPTYNGTNFTTLTDWTSGSGGNNGYNFLVAPGVADTTGSYSAEYGGPLTFWGSNNGGVNVIPNSSPDGGNYVAMDPAFQQGPLFQTISGLTIGTTYTLSFYWAAGQQSGFTGATTEGLTVSLGDESHSTAIFNNPSHEWHGWFFETFHYTATSETETLTFTANGGPPGLPPFVFLDGVSLAVPEPSTMIGSLLMFSVFGAVWARKRFAA